MSALHSFPGGYPDWQYRYRWWIAGILLFGFVPLGPLTAPVQAQWRARVDLYGGAYPESDIAEGRTRVFTQYDQWLGPAWYLKAGAYADGVVRDDGDTGATLQPDEAYLERRGDRADIRLGYSIVVWGLLEEIQPTDIVNPLDISRFILEGRAEARLPVPLTLLKVYLPADWTFETIWVPFPRDRTFDQVAQASSPFRPKPPAPVEGIAIPESDDSVSIDDSEYGARLVGTTRRIDWGLAVYRDRIDNDVLSLTGVPEDAAASVAARLKADRPLRWMIGLEMETLIASWILRGETAVFLDDPIQVLSPILAVVETTTVQTGAGISRRYDQTTVYLDGIFQTADDPAAEDDEFSVVTGVAHRFHGGRREARLFGLWNTQADSGFARVILSAELRENLRAEFVGGIFWGDGQDLFSELNDADFVALRLKTYF